MLVSKLSYASLDAEMSKVFDSLGYSANITPGGAYKDQSGGFYTGGRIYARVPAINTQIANIQMPGYRAGCGGIDIFGGGFSYISGQEIVSAMKKIASNAQGYAFNLAMQTITPQIYSTMTELQSWAQRINSMNINSCESAALAVGGLWPKSDASSNYLCNVMSTSDGAASDWVKSRHSCGAEGKRYEQTKNVSKKEGFKDQLGEEFNLAWKAIRKNGFLSSNNYLSEFFMSISGSIISKLSGEGENARPIKMHLPSLATNIDLIDMLMYGSSTNAQIYKCNDNADDKCLYTSLQSLNVSKDKALLNKIDAVIRSIATKMRDNIKLTEEEKGFINATHIPILSVITIQTSYREGDTNIDVNELSEVIAYDILLYYLESILDLVSQSIKELQKIQIDDNIISEFRADIVNVRKQIADKRHTAYQQALVMLKVVESLKLQKAQMQQAFANQMNVEE
jgi:conjugative transfer pilus assembly protein TraH